METGISPILIGILGSLGGLLSLSVSIYVGALLADVDDLSYRRSLLIAPVTLLASSPFIWLAPRLHSATALALLTGALLIVPVLALALGHRIPLRRATGAGLAHIAVLAAIFLVFSVLILGGVDRIPPLLAGENVFRLGYEF